MRGPPVADGDFRGGLTTGRIEAPLGLACAYGLAVPRGSDDRTFGIVVRTVYRTDLLQDQMIAGDVERAALRQRLGGFRLPAGLEARAQDEDAKPKVRQGHAPGAAWQADEPTQTLAGRRPE